MLKPETSHVESHGRAALKNYIIQASTLLELSLIHISEPTRRS